MNPKLKQFATFQWLSGGTALRAVLKDGPGTLHAVYSGVPLNGQDFSTSPDARYYLYDNSATAAGTLIVGQYGKPDGKALEFDLDFTQGLAICLEGANNSAGLVTVVYS